MTEVKWYLGIFEFYFVTQLCEHILFLSTNLKNNFIVDKIIEFEGLSYFGSSTVLCG